MAQPAPPPAPKAPLITLRYNGPAPAPHPPCTDPTPEEEYQQSEANRQAMQQQKVAQAHANANTQQEQQPSKGSSLLGSLAKVATVVATQVEKTASDLHAKSEREVRRMVAQKNFDRFLANFPELAGSDQLVCDYSCRAMHQGQQVPGNLQVTSRHLLFCSDLNREILAWSEIASIQRSVALETLDNGPPFIMPVPAPHVLPTCLQIFTVRGQVIQFLYFESTLLKAGSLFTNTLKGRPIDRAYNFVDHAWRAAVQVPLQGVQYAQY